MPSPVPTLVTARLRLTPLQPDDADAIQRTFPQWAVVKYLNNTVPWPYPPDGAATFLSDVALPAMRNGTGWFWGIRLNTVQDRLIGVINLVETPDDNRGFWLDPAWHGQGLMTEACDAVTEFWFSMLHKPTLRVSKAIANAGSRRISERSGMRIIATGDRAYVCGELPSETWEITREEWLARPR